MAKMVNRKFDAKMYHRYNDLVLTLKLQSALINNRFSGKMRSAAYRMLLICVVLDYIEQGRSKWSGFFYCLKGAAAHGKTKEHANQQARSADDRCGV